MDFLGCRVYPRHMELNRRSRRRFVRKLRTLEVNCRAGLVSEQELQQRTTALVAFTRAGGVASCAFAAPWYKSGGGNGHRPRTGSFAAGAGTTTAGTAGPRTATGTIPATGTTTWASAWPQLSGQRWIPLPD